MPLIDALGKQHQPDRAARIVSLVPSITETLCDLGLATQVLGRTGFCIHPAGAVAGIAKVGGTKDINIEKIRRLAPTHVVVNIDENDRAAVEALAAFVPHIVVTHPLGPQDNPALLRLLGGIFCAGERAEAWCTAFAQARAAVQTLPKGPPATMLYCIWQDPWMSISPDTYIARMMAEIGWRLPQLDDAARYPRFQWSDQLLGQVDAVLLSTEPYRFTGVHADALEKQLGKPVHLIDGEMMSWYGTRALAGMAYLGEIARTLR